jgi:Tol biopolymer transport system component
VKLERGREGPGVAARPNAQPVDEGPLTTGDPSSTRPYARLAVAVVALAVAAAGFGAAAVVLARLDAGSRAADPINGRIAFAALGDGTWQIYSAEPDGTGLVQLTNVAPPFVVANPTWSPDGSMIAYVVRASATSQSLIWVMRADGSDAHAIANGGSNWGPAWSPDGTRIAYTHGYDIHVMNADGTNDINLMPEPAGLASFDPTWSRDGEHIAFVGRDLDDDLYVMRSDGSEMRTLFSAPGAQREPAWSPDGSTIAFSDHTYATELEFGELTLIDPTGAVTGRLSNLPQIAQAPAWSPDGQQIVFMANVSGEDRQAIYVMNADGTDVREIHGLPANASWPAWQSLSATNEEATPTPSISPASSPGSIVATGSLLPEGKLLVNVDDGTVEVLEEGLETSTTIGENLFALDLSPDGTRALVSTPWDSIGPETALVSLDLTTGERTLIADLGSWGMPARWSPDGSAVAVRVGERNLLCIRTLAIEGPRCLPDLGRVYEFDWSPDGTRLVFEQGLPGSLTILDVGTEQTSVLVRWDDPAILSAVSEAGLGEAERIQFQGPRWSSSGRFVAALAMVGTEDGHSGNVVVVFDLQGNVVAHGVPFGEFSSAREWSPVADVFAYASGEPPYQIVDLRALDVSTGQDHILASTADVSLQTIRSLTWSPSGRWLAMVTIVGSGGYFSSEIRVLDVTGVEPPRIFESAGLPELVGWGR